MDRPIMAYEFALIVYIMEKKTHLLTHSDTRYIMHMRVFEIVAHRNVDNWTK